MIATGCLAAIDLPDNSFTMNFVWGCGSGVVYQIGNSEISLAAVASARKNPLEWKTYVVAPTS